MVSIDQYHVFQGQHLLQLGIKLGYLTVVSRVPCARVVCCAARLEREDSSIIDSFSSSNIDSSSDSERESDGNGGDSCAREGGDGGWHRGSESESGEL